MSTSIEREHGNIDNGRILSIAILTVYSLFVSPGAVHPSVQHKGITANLKHLKHFFDV